MPCQEKRPVGILLTLSHCFNSAQALESRLSISNYNQVVQGAEQNPKTATSTKQEQSIF
jgi:hypothetical protein